MKRENVVMTYEALAELLPNRLGVNRILAVEAQPERGTFLITFDGCKYLPDPEGATGYTHPIVSTYEEEEYGE